MSKIVQQLSDQSAIFDASTYDWSRCQPLGVHNRCLRLDKKNLSCGKILAHAKEQVSALREKVGVRLCCFKIGVTSNPLARFPLYLNKGYSVMWVIWSSTSVDIVHMLGAALLSEFGRHVGCQNQLGTALNKADRPDPPYFVYMFA